MSTLHIAHLKEPSGLMEHILAWLPECAPTRIFLKPNWVKHEINPAFPITALVTSSEVIDAVIQACLRKYHRLVSVTVGDVPLQSCDFDLLTKQTGLDRLIEKYRAYSGPSVRFLDLRRERWREDGGFLVRSDTVDGDPLGYAEVIIDSSSYLDEVSDRAHLFRVSDYDPSVTRVAHTPGFHRYLIARSVLDADLFINLPKMKTHQKAGVTGALKNLVGINGSKAFLVHHRHGLPSRGGDEFAPDVDRIFILQTRLRERFQKSSPNAFRAFRIPWQWLKRMRGIQTVGTPENLDRRFYVGPGSWYGNDSVWRMVYDLNRIILMGSASGGQLLPVPQRNYFCILDGIVAGEGNGPLQPLPVQSRILVGGDNPFAVDHAMARLMGYDPSRIRILANCSLFRGSPWEGWTSDGQEVSLNGHVLAGGLVAVPTVHRFLPPPGWAGHIEAAPERGEVR